MAKELVKVNLQESADTIRSLLKDTINNLLAIGDELRKVKKELPHGEFEIWIQKEFGWNRSTSWRLMKASEQRITDIKQIWGNQPNVASTQLLEAPPLPEGKYQVIYADPPWDIGSMVLEKWESPLEDKYATLTKEEIQEYTDEDGKKIYDLFAPDCVIFLWVTQTKLPEALEILNYWGFKYHITITWDKGGGWSANGFFRNTELLLFGYRGKLSSIVKQEGEYIPTLITEKKTTHSTKPKIMREWIEKRTMGKRIELFARHKYPGWDTWGNEI